MAIQSTVRSDRDFAESGRLDDSLIHPSLTCQSATGAAVCQPAPYAFPAANREVEIDALAIARLPVQARQALDVYVKAAPNAGRRIVQRLTATVEYAEGKFDQALTECADVNPYCKVIQVESLFALGRTQEAEAMRAAFLARMDGSAESRALAIMQYRAAHSR